MIILFFEGLLRPFEAAPLLNAIRKVTNLPIHFHTHATSSGSIASCLEMARHGCEIIDFCTASMADGTSQPSLNAFVAMMEGAPNDTQLNFLNLEPYDIYWVISVVFSSKIVFLLFIFYS